MSKEEKLNKIWYKGKSIPAIYKVLEKLFSIVSSFRRKLYAWGVLKTHKVKCPVVVVGNISVGGVGKTPFVIWLVRQLLDKGLKVGVVSRGYGGKRESEPMLVIPQTSAKASGDEALLIAKHTNVKVIVGKNRAKAAKKLYDEYKVDVIIADDGLQHYAMHRDVELVLLDAVYGMGNQHLLPAGPLREPKSRLNEVDMVIFKGKKEEQNYFEYKPLLAYQLGNVKQRRSIESFRNQPIHAVAGIAHPDSFFNMLSNAGLAVIKHPLDDHHQISEVDLSFNNDNLVLITEKDAVKCAEMKLDNVWVVVLKLEVLESTKQQVLKLIQTTIKEKGVS